MMNNWTYGRKIAAGFSAVVILTAAAGLSAIFLFRSVVATKDRVIAVDAQSLVEAERLLANAARRQAAGRGYLLTGNEDFLQDNREARATFADSLNRIKTLVTGEEQRLLQDIERASTEHSQASDRVFAMRRSGATTDVTAHEFDQTVSPLAERVDRAVAAFAEQERRLLVQGNADATAHATQTNWIIIVIILAAVVLAGLTATFLTRSLTQQIGTAVSQVQASSAELQTAANQQATGSREHATAMSEIATTVNELLATSRQIAESAQRVVSVAEQTASSARSGEGTVELTNESISGIRRQIDVVVAHMLDLGRKSQQIGSVLEIVSELAEQTNILAINATIEAAGAGESGKRFGVVADEIRKLADRVAGSTKEIRNLIEDVRSAVNTTVMATESGSKAVDVGAGHFAGAAAAFKQISGLVSTTTEAAREIELSTKQQTTAVEQVTVAISSITQVSKESEASSLQTLQTAGLLNQYSSELLRLIRPQAA